MKVSESWLREWINPPVQAQQLVHQLTMAGLEVDAYHPVAGEFTHVVVAEVLSTKAHPQADKLTICEVNTGHDAPLQIVCGAANVRPKLKVALAMIGAQLPGGMKIKETKLRGELSQGMLCSVAELGIEDKSDGIMELPEDAPVGQDLREYLVLNDHILDIELTPNRADCLSVLGIARELAALNQQSLELSILPLIPPTHDDTLVVQLKASEACSQYCGRIIKHINPQANTPLWMIERLRRSGIRALHPVVDVTNYVMLELGQPMHAFDFNTLHGGITVRFAKPQETLVLLDGQSVTLTDQVLVIADESQALAIAGVMGGARSAVQEHTTDIFLESAFFNPLSIAGVARRYGLCTDSSQRFERGVDPELQLRALARATELLLSIVGGKAGPVISVKAEDQHPKRCQTTFHPSRVKQLTGVDIPDTLMCQYLESLGLAVIQGTPLWTVHIPSHRFDIHEEVDLVEELIRLYGYDKIQTQPMQAPLAAGKKNPQIQLPLQIAAFLKSRGYNETISYSFVDPALQEAIYPEAQTLTLLNPISEDLSQMRLGMWPGLIASMIHNVHRQQSMLRFFETGVIFEHHEGQLQERACVAGLLTGEQGGLNWSEPRHTFDFFDAKGDLQALFASLNLKSIQFIPKAHTALHPGQSAEIHIQGKPAGWIGALHPKLLDALDLTQTVLVFELYLSELLPASPAQYHCVSKFPQIRRDLSFLVREDITAAQIEIVVSAIVGQDWLRSFDVFDVYTGTNVPQGKKSLGIALTLQDESRTLVDAEINDLIRAIITILTEQFDIILRD